MREFIAQNMNIIGRSLFGIAGGMFAFLQPTWPFILVCTLVVFADCYTAWSLSRRVKRRYPNANDGKFKSKYAGRVFETLIKIYIFIILAYLIEFYILEGLPVRLANISAAAVCFWQAWSILENESSCNNARWAKIAQQVMINKTERHFDIDLSELKKIDRNKEIIEQQENDERSRLQGDES